MPSVRVDIIGDSSSLQRAYQKAATETKAFGTHATTSAKAVDGLHGSVTRGATGLSTFAKSALLAGGALVGVGSLYEGIKKTVTAAEGFNQAQRQLDAQLRANGESFKAVAPWIDKLQSSQVQLGFTSTQTEKAFTQLDRASGSAALAYKYMGVTADLAAARHIDLSKAALLVGKVIDGNTTALNRYGIAVPKGTSVTDALAIAQQKLSGQAAASVTPFEKFHAVLNNIEVVIGNQLLPVVTKYIDKVTGWLSQADHQRQITDAVKTAMHDMGVVVEGAWHIFQQMEPTLKTLAKDGFTGVKTAIDLAKGAFDVLSDVFGKHKATMIAAIAAVGVAITLAIGPEAVAIVGAIVAVGYIRKHFGALKDFFLTLGQEITNAFTYAWVEVQRGAIEAAIQIVKAFDISVMGHHLIPGVHSLIKGLQAELDKLHPPNMDWSAAATQAGVKSGDAWKKGFASGTIGTYGPPAPATVGTYGPPTPGTSAPTSTGGTGKLSTAQLMALWVKAGGNPAQARTAAAIAQAESSGRVGALNNNPSTGDYSVGPWQINYYAGLRAGRTAQFGTPQHLMTDPLANARAAVSLSGGGRDFSPWSTYKSGAYQSYLSSGAGPQGSLVLPTAAADAAKAADKAKKAADSAAKKAATAAAKAVAAAVAAATKIADGIVANVETVVKATTEAVANARTAGKSPKDIAAGITHALAVNRTEIELLASDIKTADATERPILQKELDRLKTSRGRLHAQLVAAIKKEADQLAGPALAAAGADDIQIAQLQQMTQVAVPGRVTDYTKQITNIVSQQIDVLTQGLATLKAKGLGGSAAAGKLQTALNAALASQEGLLQNVVQTARTAYDTVVSKFSTSFGKLTQDIVSQFQANTQTQLTAIAQDPKYYQGGAKTPSETKLAAMQAEDALKSFTDALASAQAGGDQAQIDAAQRGLDEYNLSLAAVKERTDADNAYAAAVKQTTDDRTKQEGLLTQKLEDLGTAITTGKGTIKGLDPILTTFGISMGGKDGKGGATNAVTNFARDLKSATTDAGGIISSLTALQNAFDALVGWVNAKTGANIQTGGGGGGGFTPSATNFVSENGNPGPAASVLGGAAQYYQPSGYTTSGGTGNYAKKPMLAAGGFITKSGLAYVHAGETVTPVGKGGAIIHINVQGFVGDERKLTDMVLSGLRREKTRLATLGIT